MKTKLLITIMFLAFCIGCKKNTDTQPDSVPIDYNQRTATIKTTISGKWYYQAYDVKYFDDGNSLIYDDIAS